MRGRRNGTIVKAMSIRITPTTFGVNSVAMRAIQPSDSPRIGATRRRETPLDDRQALWANTTNVSSKATAVLPEWDTGDRPWLEGM